MIDVQHHHSCMCNKKKRCYFTALMSIVRVIVKISVSLFFPGIVYDAVCFFHCEPLTAMLCRVKLCPAIPHNHCYLFLISLLGLRLFYWNVRWHLNFCDAPAPFHRHNYSIILGKFVFIIDFWWGSRLVWGLRSTRKRIAAH